MHRDDFSHSRYQALLLLLRTADRIWNTSRLFFDRWDLSPSQFNVLNLLHDNPDGLSQIELSRELIMHRSNVTGLVDRLERRGLVQRNDLASDRRAYRVVVTRRGAALLEQILPQYYRRADEVWESMSTERVSQLTADLKQLAENAESIGARENRLSHKQPKQEQAGQGRGREETDQ
jgi:DNA-binding MarR family transcriptional regulator